MMCSPLPAYDSLPTDMLACCCLVPQTAELLGVPQSQWPSGSFESGQMVLDKSRHWRGLVMAMYINTYSSFWCVDALRSVCLLSQLCALLTERPAVVLAAHSGSCCSGRQHATGVFACCCLRRQPYPVFAV